MPLPKEKREMPRKKLVKKPVAKSAGKIEETWTATVDALTRAEAELEKQVKALIKRNKITVEDATQLLNDFQARVVRERKKTRKDLEAWLRRMQSRVKKERSNVTKLANDAVQSALATFNIPSRKEVADLTRKVDELSKKIDSLRRR
jgi:polyhydroxyalkanoate synthesis regulator phasin